MRTITLFRAVDTEQMTVFRTLASLVAARVPLVEALDECLSLTQTTQVRHWLSRARDQVNAGETFSDALAAEPTIPTLVTALVRTSESTGALADALEKAADYLQMQHERSRTLVSALVYPTLILVATLIASLFLATVVMPQIKTMYHHAGKDLPLITHVMSYTVYILLALAAVIILYATASRYRQKKNMTDGSPSAPIPKPKIIVTGRFRLPLLTKLTETHTTAFWAYSFGALTSHGVLLPEALKLSAEAVPAGSVMAREIHLAYRRIVAGEKPGDAFQAIQTLPSLARRLLAGGDSAGNLADACQRIHRIYDAEYQLWNRRLITVAEPIAVVIAGVFVILAALAVVIPAAGLGDLL